MVCIFPGVKQAPVSQVLVVHALILSTWVAEIQKIEVQGQPGQTVTKNPSPNIARAKLTGSAAQVVQHLLCKHSPEFKPKYIPHATKTDPCSSQFCSQYCG